MAIRKRNKNINVEDTGVSKFGNSDDLKNKSSIETNVSYDLPDVRSFKDQAIQVLNTLESEYGINIYDETRTPGMYLKKGSLKVSDNVIQNILKQDNSHENTNFQKTSRESPKTELPVSATLFSAMLAANK